MHNMPQFTREEAIQFYYSESWRSWSEEELARFQLNQELCCIPLDVYQDALERVTGRNVMTHEMDLNMMGLKDELDGTGEPPDHQMMLAAFNVTWLEK